MTSWTLIGSGVDWITATCNKSKQVTGFLTLGARYLEEEKALGNPGHTASFNGYHGSSSLHCFVGYRRDGAIVRLSGPAARLGWRGVAERATNITRVDCAVTLASEPPESSHALDIWAGINRHGLPQASETDYSLIQTIGGGQSLYCGSRSSPLYGRLYDKYHESKGRYPAGSWRYEVEYKSDVVKDLMAHLLARHHDEVTVLGCVTRRFADWGITIPWQGETVRWKPHDDRGGSTVERRMKWVREGVAPALNVLKDYYSADEILTALNLLGRVEPKERGWAESVLRSELDDLLG